MLQRLKVILTCQDLLTFPHVLRRHLLPDGSPGIVHSAVAAHSYNLVLQVASRKDILSLSGRRWRRRPLVQAVVLLHLLHAAWSLAASLSGMCGLLCEPVGFRFDIFTLEKDAAVDQLQTSLYRSLKLFFMSSGCNGFLLSRQTKAQSKTSQPLGRPSLCPKSLTSSLYRKFYVATIVTMVENLEKIKCPISRL